MWLDSRLSAVTAVGIISGVLHGVTFITLHRLTDQMQLLAADMSRFKGENVKPCALSCFFARPMSLLEPTVADRWHGFPTRNHAFSGSDRREDWPLKSFRQDDWPIPNDWKQRPDDLFSPPNLWPEDNYWTVGTMAPFAWDVDTPRGLQRYVSPRYIQSLKSMRHQKRQRREFETVYKSILEAAAKTQVSDGAKTQVSDAAEIQVSDAAKRSLRKPNADLVRYTMKHVAYTFPRIVHQTWRTAEIPRKLAPYVESWMRLGWQYEFWDDARLDTMFVHDFPQYAYVYRRFSGVERADVGRLALLYRYGGVYADLDTEVIGNVDQLLASAQKFHATHAVEVIVGMENMLHARLLEKRTQGIVSNAVIIATPQAPFLMHLLQAIFRKQAFCDQDPVECTGPRVLDAEIRRYNQSHVLVLPYTYLSPTIALWNAGTMVSSCKFPSPSRKHACKALRNVLESSTLLFSWRTIVVHHWQCSWCRSDAQLKETVALHSILPQYNSTPCAHSTEKSLYST